MFGLFVMVERNPEKSRRGLQQNPAELRHLDRTK